MAPIPVPPSPVHSKGTVGSPTNSKGPARWRPATLAYAAVPCAAIATAFWRVASPYVWFPESGGVEYRDGDSYEEIIARNSRRLQGGSPTTSGDCRSSLDAMTKDINWQTANTTFTRWCRVKAENVMARCCNVADFAKGRGEGCNDCAVNCVHAPFINLCNDHFGTACTIKRKPFYRSGAPELEISETFCVPEECNNHYDRAALMPWYSATYKPRRAGWHRDYDESSEPDCPSAAGTVIAVLAFLGVLAAPAGMCAKFMFVAPKERGAQLVSQSDMQEEAEEDEDDEENDDDDQALLDQ